MAMNHSVPEGAAAAAGSETWAAGSVPPDGAAISAAIFSMSLEVKMRVSARSSSSGGWKGMADVAGAAATGGAATAGAAATDGAATGIAAATVGEEKSGTTG